MIQKFFLLLLPILAMCALQSMDLEQGYSREITELSLRGKSIKNFKLLEYLKEYPNLQKLDFSNNQIDKLKPAMLEGMPPDFKLVLQNNPIKKIYKRCYRSIPYYMNCTIDVRGSRLNEKQKTNLGDIVYNPDAGLEYFGCGACSGSTAFFVGKIADLLCTVGHASMFTKALFIPPLAVVGFFAGLFWWETCTESIEDSNEQCSRVLY